MYAFVCVRVFVAVVYDDVVVALAGDMVVVDGSLFVLRACLFVCLLCLV